MNIAFYMPPEKVTISILKDFLAEMSACGIPVDTFIPVGLTGHACVVGLDRKDMMAMADLLDMFRFKVTNIGTEKGTYKEMFGRDPEFGTDRVRAFVMMGGRIGGKDL